jgi:hypothetical protein
MKVISATSNFHALNLESSVNFFVQNLAIDQ